MEGGRLEEQLVVQLHVHHPEQEGLLVVAHWCCIRLHSLFARVSPMKLHAPIEIGAYLALIAVALELLPHPRAAESP